MQKIFPCIWFEDSAQEAMNFYGSVFKNSKIGEMQGVVGMFEIEDQQIMLLQGGPMSFKRNEAFSLYVNCKDQAETDYYWNRLGEGGSYSMCGWLKDKFGVSWQIVPEALPKLLTHSDRERANRAMQAMMKMQKLEIAELEAAFNG